MSNRSSRKPEKVRLDRFQADAHFSTKAEKSKQPPKPNFILAAKHMIPYQQPCKNQDCKNERRAKSAYCGKCKT